MTYMTHMVIRSSVIASQHCGTVSLPFCDLVKMTSLALEVDLLSRLSLKVAGGSLSWEASSLK